MLFFKHIIKIKNYYEGIFRQSNNNYINPIVIKIF